MTQSMPSMRTLKTSMANMKINDSAAGAFEIEGHSTQNASWNSSQSANELRRQRTANPRRSRSDAVMNSLGKSTPKRCMSDGLRRSGSKVSFNESATETVEIERQPTRNASWYSSDELRKFRKTTPKRNSSDCSKEYVRSLLSIQKIHQDMGIQDPKGLRQMSRAYSKESIRQAIERAHEILEEE